MSLKAVFKEESPVKADFGGIVTGLAATVSVGTVTDGETASVVNSGTAQNAKLDFVLPRGAKGDPGGVVSFNGRTGTVMPEKGDYTASDVGAAPDGYGLGSNAKTVTDFNTATENGWYRNIAVGPDVHAPNDAGQWFCLTSAYTNGALRQDFYAISAGYHGGGTHAIRWYHMSVFGGWSPFEWVDPPMKVGVEYRTTERFNAKPVYAQIVNCGALEARTMKTVMLKIPVDWVVSCTGMQGPNTNRHRQASPFYYNNGSTELVFYCSAEAYHYETEDNLYVYLYATQATTASYALVKYTKESD